MTEDRRYEVTKVVATVKDPYSGKIQTVTLEGTGIVEVHNTQVKNKSGKGYHPEGRGASMTMKVTSEKVTNND